MKNLLALLLGCVLAFSSSVSAQITGIQNVPGAYPDLAAAFAALNAQGVGAGGATINVTAPQTCPVNGFQLGSATLNASLSSANPLILNGNSNSITGYTGTRAGSLTSGANDAMFVISGVDYLTIQNFVFNDLAANNTPTLAMEHAIGMYNRLSTVGSADGCKYINITGCAFNMGSFATLGAAVSATQYVWNVATAVAWEAGTENDIHRSITINNNQFNSIYNGIHYRGSSSKNGRALTITNNTFSTIGGGASTAYGTYMLYLDSILYNNNTSIGSVGQTTTSYHAFASTNCGGLQEAINNNITLQSGTTTSAVNGITFTSVGVSRKMNNNTVSFGSFPSITTATINGLIGSYTGGNNNITMEMNGNTISNQTIPPTTGTVTLLSNGVSSGTNRVSYTNNNTITNLTRANSGTMYCISLGTANEVYASGNTLNNITVTNNNAAASTTLIGFYGNGSPLLQNIFDNVVTNFTVSGTSTNTSSSIRGIQSTTTASGTAETYNNIVGNLSFGAGVLTGNVGAIYTSLAPHNIHHNKIYNISAFQNNGLVRGIDVVSGATNNIYNNFISGLTTPNANSNFAVAGISVGGGTTCNISFNTIYPSSAGPLVSSGALFGAAGIYYTTSVATIVKSNIVNITGAANGDAYISAIKRSGIGTNGTKPSNFTGSNNIYHSNYIYGEGTTLSTATNVYYVTGGATGTADPTFNTSCGLYKVFMGELGTFTENNLTSVGTGLYVPTGISFAESAATTATTPTVTNDYNYVTRATFPDMGALEFAGTGLDATGPSITYDLVPNTICTNSVTVTAEITDPSGVNTTSGTKPRLYFKGSTHNNVILTNTSASNGWKYVEASNSASPFIFNIDFSLLFGGGATVGQTIDYFIVAQDMALPPNVGTNIAIYPAGFCPTSVALTTAAFPVSGYDSFDILSLPTGLATAASNTELCISDDIILSLTGGIATGAQYQWQSSPAGANMWTNIPGATEITYEAIGVSVSTDFRCIISCGGVPISVSPSTPISVTVLSPAILTTTPASSCTPGPISLTLGATATTGATINWYAAPTGGSPIGTGGTFNTPPISTTTTYYVAASSGSSNYSAALPNQVATPGTGYTLEAGLFFSALTDLTIEGVYVYPIGTGAGDVVIALQDGSVTPAVTILSTTVTLTGTAAPYVKTYVPLNFSVPVGTNYKLMMMSRSGLVTSLIRESGSAWGTYPLTVPGVISITNGNCCSGNTTSTSYYYFYDWNIRVGCESERIPVTASIVTSAPTCANDTTVCLSSGAFALSGALPEGGVYSGTGVSAGMFTPSVAGVGTHLITYTICGLTCTYNITVQAVTPTIAITETSAGTNNDGIICNGASATLTASSGSTYAWSNGATTQAISVNTAGIYTVTVTNAIGCTGSTSSSVTISPAPSITTILTQPTTCLATNGAIDLTVTTPGTYTYMWSNGATTQDISGLEVGSYIVTITSGATTCQSTATITLIGPGGCDACPAIPNVTVAPSPACPSVAFTLSTNSMTDLGVTYGVKFKSFPSAVANPYTGGTDLAVVSNAMLTSSSSAASATGSIASPGNYVVYAILDPTPSDPACRPFASVALTVSTLPTAGINVTETSGTTSNDGIICAGSSATLTGTGGGTYQWSTGATTVGITVSTAGTYTVTVTSSAGCTASTSRMIIVNPVPSGVIQITEASGSSINDGNICHGFACTLTATATGTYIWSNGNTTNSITEIPNATTTYTVTITNTNGCSAVQMQTVIVNPNPDVNITVTESSGVQNDGVIIEGSSATLGAVATNFRSDDSGTRAGYTYRWSNNATTQQIVVSPLATTTYTVTVTNMNGCTKTASTIVSVVPPPCFIVCSGDQNITLPAGACEYTLPNFVTFIDMCDIYEIVQTSGPVAGSNVAPGTFDLSFELRRKNNGLVVDDCEFTLTVVGFTTPVGSLTCNNRVNVSIDENCKVTLNADMFLEGGNYACYWDYQINIWPFHSQANAINNVPQEVALELPFGEHTYEIVSTDGNRCWGTFIVEDKLAPVLSCNCVDNPVIVPITNITGSFTLDSPKLEVSTIAATCTKTTTANRQMPYYVVIPFSVSAPGLITFSINATLNTSFPFSVNSNFGYQYIYSAPPNPLDLCDNYVAAQGFTTNGTWTPTAIVLNGIGGQFVPGVTYYYVFASAYIQNIMNYSITFTHNAGGQVLSVQNPADAPECKFLCYDIEVVKRETVGMLYNIPGQNQNKAKLTTPPGVADCGDVKVTFEDRITPSDCGDTKLIRDWTAIDGNGNKSTCSQTFTFKPLKVSDLTPPTPELHLTCGLETTPQAVAGYTDEDSRTGTLSAANIGAYADDYSATPTVVELNEGFANAYFTFEQIGFDGKMHAQKVDPSRCNIYTTYHDDFFPACGNGCGGNMKVVRTWKLLDWCTRETTEYIQVIKAVDEKAPSFGVKDVTVSVDPWECAANYSVEKPWELNDNCAKPEELKWGIKLAPGVEITGTQPNYRISGLTKGVHSITYWAEDCCGNYTEKSANIYVIDAAGPIPVAKQNIVLSLTGSGTGTDGAAKIYGWQIDNGSYDQCSDVRFEVRRVDGGSCGNVGANGTHNNNSTYNDNNGYPSEVPGAVWFHPQDNAQDTDGGEFVKFCCEDIPAGSDFGIHDVELRVWDDGNMNGIYGDNDIIDGMKDNYNTTWVTIRVENKLSPALVCPPDVTITCDMELNLSLDAETNVNDVNLTMTGYPQAYDLCSNLQVTYKDQWVGQHDPVCKSGTVRRTFKVTKGSVVVTCTQFITVSTLTAPFTVTFPNQGQTTEWDKCSFSLDDARDAANASIKRPIVNYGQCDIVGENIKIDTFLFEDGACKKWKVTYSYKNWCTGEEINTIAGQPIVHWYAFKDVTAPVLSCTNQMFAANPNPQNPNGGCEAQVALEASASDKLICAEESWIKWQMFFDGWNDGTVDRLGSSFVNKSWAGIWVPQAKFISGVLNPTWVALQNQHPNLPLADLVYVTYIKPTAASGGTAKLPVGTGATAFILNAENISHKVLWKVTDGCGNVDQCESTVMVVDKKAPTPYCVSVSTALMQTSPQMVELWARDFDKGAFDNCTPQSKLYFTFDGAAPIYSRVNEEHYYKVVGGVSVNATAAEYAQGKAYRWLPASRSAGFVWTAAGDFNVQVNVWDEAWNTDYCSIVLSVREGTASIISGTVATASGKGVSDVTVILESNAPEFPKSTLTDQHGVYRFDVLTGNDYQVKAEKNDDYLNGVSTLDLVLIQRHILGLQALDGNFNLIAADANNDGKVTASDLTDLRKLILGITPVLQNNGSWRFVAEGTVVETSPIAFIEAIDINNMNSVMDNQDFVGVKIGDVNRSVSSDVNTPEVESRSNANVEMSVAEASIAAGEVVEIPVTAANFSEVSGFQYTMNLNGASFVGVQSGVLEVNANNVGVISNNVITMSYSSTEAVNANEGAVLFTLTVKADKAMKVSEMISLNSDVTRAESYNSDLKVGKVSLGVRTAPVAGIELFQNEPNPFKGMTTVSFEMPEASTAKLSVYDVTGKVVTLRNINAVKGLNSEIFTKDQLGVSGVLYYTLVSGDFTATKKMIIVE